MLINCPHCAARVNGEVEKLFPVYHHDDFGTVQSGFRVSLLKCPSCHWPLVAKEELQDYEKDILFGNDKESWSEARRVWPDPESSLDKSIPADVRASLEEARKCLTSGAYTASVVMSGRALEAVARHFHVGGKAQKLMLGTGLKELHDSGKIDWRLYEWGKELQEHRNLAAHASSATFVRVDAEDLYEFGLAICEYLFVLQDRYERFMQRKANKGIRKEA